MRTTYSGKYLASEPRINGAGGLIPLGYDSSFAVEEMFHNIFRGKTSRDERDFLSSWRIDELTSISLKEIT
jgi:hypothetical protein